MITIKTKINEIYRWLTTQKGNVIAYIALVLIIFGVLGGVMASLLTSSMTSSATPNYSRRALYMTEAGMRYGLSELRNTEDWKGKIEDLSTITYTLNPSETFDLNIVGPWYESTSLQDKTAGQTLTLTVPRGEMPVEYSIPVAPPRLSIINFAYTWEGIKPSSSAEIQGYTRIDESTIQVEVADSFVVSSGEIVCLAVPIDVESTQLPNTPVLAGDTLYVAYQARDIFSQYGGAFENQQRAMEHLIIVVPLALLIIMGLLYLMFGQLRFAFLIFVNLPFALSGGIFLLYIGGLYLSVSASIGFVALFGVAVLNGIVLVAHLNALRQGGMELRTAVLQGAADRLRPVLMSALVASLGFIPMAFNTGPGSEVQRPLATVVIGGLITATLLTLLVVPTLYHWMERKKDVPI